MSSSDLGEVSTDVTKKRIVKRFILFAFGVLLVFSSYNFTLNLQSSINVEGGLGVTALACSHFASTFFALISTPILILRFGPKKCMILSEVAIMVYIAANYYPTHYTLLPAAVLAGFAESLIWPCLTLLNVYYGTEYWKNKNSDSRRSLGYYVNLFTGCYFSIHHLSHIFGGIVGFIILKVFDNESSDKILSANITIASENKTSSWITNSSITDHLQYCGSQDCQDKDKIDENKENYVPADRFKLSILLTCFVLMCLTSAILHAFMLPHFRPIRSVNSENEKAIVDTHQDNLKAENSEEVFLQPCEKLPLSSSDRQRSSVDVEDYSTQPRPEFLKEDVVCSAMMLQTLKDVGEQLTRLKQVLIIPITLYEGMLLAFIFGNLPRAFVSCVTGFSSISIYMCLYGIAHVTASLIVSRIGKRVGRTIIYLFVGCLDAVNLLFCLLWTPSTHTSWMIVLSYLAFGFTDGTWQPLTNVTHMEFFPNRRHVAGAVWSATQCLGFAITFAWSTALCVYVKIYIMFGVLGLGLSLALIAERIHKREKLNDQALETSDCDKASRERKTKPILPLI